MNEKLTTQTHPAEIMFTFETLHVITSTILLYTHMAPRTLQLNNKTLQEKFIITYIKHEFQVKCLLYG